MVVKKSFCSFEHFGNITAITVTGNLVGFPFVITN